MIDNCSKPELLPVDKAVTNIIEAIKQQPISLKIESITLDQAVNRILATDILSKLDVPPTDNAAMDGYAYIHANLDSSDTLSQVGTAFAGNAYESDIHDGECIRIMTGAPIPKGADTVIMQEETKRLDNNKIQFLKTKPIGNNVRKAGESIQSGSIVLHKGTRLTPGKIGLLASLGEVNIQVYKQIKIGVLATGDELAYAGEPLSSGQIYESNRMAIITLLQQFGANVIDYGIVKDDLTSISQTMLQADKECDVVISSGGVSVGDADYVKDVLNNIGQVGFWKVAIKPGKPFAFGKLSNSWFCGLPGNPVSSFVTCQLLVLPLICELQNEITTQREPITAIALKDIRKKVGRKDYQRGVYYVTEAGQIQVEPNGPQGSGIMTSVANANCYIVLDIQQGSVQKGETVRILPFEFTYH